MNMTDVFKLIDCRKFGEPKEISINLDTATKIIQSKNNLIKWSLLVDYYYILKVNLQGLLDYMNENNNNGLFEKKVTQFAEINRHTSNFLNSFYQLVSYYEKNIGDSFKQIKSFYYDNNFEYRLFYNLRNYSTHNAFAISEIERSLFDNGTEIKYIININRIINDSCINKKFSEELAKIENKKISLINLLLKFKCIIREILIDLFLYNEQNIINDFNFLIGNINNYCESQGEVYLEENGKITLSLFGAISKFLEKFSKGFIYFEKIEQTPQANPEIYSLFRRFSTIYFCNPMAVVSWD